MLEVLQKSFSVSRVVYAVLLNGKCVGMFGHAPLDKKGLGGVWMVGSEELTSNPFRFCRGVKKWWPAITRYYKTVVNLVSEQNVVHRRWLEHLGCQFSPPENLWGRGLVRWFKYDVRPS